MKISSLLPIVLVLLASASARGDEPRRNGTGPEVLPQGLRPPASDVPGDSDLIARRSASGAARPKPVPRQQSGFGIAELSVFVGIGETYAILPKGSVIFCPDVHAARLQPKASGKLVAWPDFLAANRNWISTREVTLAQVHGEAPLSETDRKTFAAAGRIVVATLRGNPITVLPYTGPQP